jgi:hypothetical protein
VGGGGPPLGSGLIHAGWALLAALLVAGHGRSSGRGEDAQAQGWTGRLMEQPFGRWLVAALGIAIAVFAIAHIRKGFGERYARHVAVQNMRPRTRSAFRLAAHVGMTARGITLGIVGGFLVAAAWRYDPTQVSGLGGALDRLLEQPFGAALLGAVALGLVLFGIYNAFIARFRVIRPR